MGQRLYVGNLGFSVTNEALKAHFETCGPVITAKIQIDRHTGKSRGFGFVEMENIDDADKAISKLDGNDFLNRRLNVNLATDRTPNPPDRGPRRS